MLTKRKGRQIISPPPHLTIVWLLFTKIPCISMHNSSRWIRKFAFRTVESVQARFPRGCKKFASKTSCQKCVKIAQSFSTCLNHGNSPEHHEILNGLRLRGFIQRQIRYFFNTVSHSAPFVHLAILNLHFALLQMQRAWYARISYSTCLDNRKQNHNSHFRWKLEESTPKPRLGAAPCWR